jgi:hypothetical protein
LPYCVVGGMAVIRKGYARTTMTVYLSKVRQQGEDAASKDRSEVYELISRNCAKFSKEVIQTYDPAVKNIGICSARFRQNTGQMLGLPEKKNMWYPFSALLTVLRAMPASRAISTLLIFLRSEAGVRPGLPSCSAFCYL